MATIARVRIGSSGYPGGPGVSTFYGIDGATLATELQNLYFNLASYVPTDLSFSIPQTGDTIEDTTGVINGQWAGAVFPPIPGTSVGIYAAPVGALFRWTTGVIADGKRVRGRTFLVPTVSSVFNTSGQVLPSVVASLDQGLGLFVTATAGNMVIWHRPFKGEVGTPTDPARPAHLGSHAVVTGHGVSTKAAVLRSRRD